jgi:hypothetical protein
MKLTPGTRLRSQVCSTEVIVVRGGEIDGDLTCGGAPLVTLDHATSDGAVPAPGLDSGNQLGKRYTDGGVLELLVTKAGTGTLGVGRTPLSVKDARPLPSSD